VVAVTVEAGGALVLPKEEDKPGGLQVGLNHSGLHVEIRAQKENWNRMMSWSCSLVRGKTIGLLGVLGHEKQDGCSRGKFDFQRFKNPNKVLNSKQKI
jgi:hypothetical protein